MITKTPEAIQKSTVAKVEGTKITRKEVDEKLNAFITQMKAKYGENYESNSDAKELLLQQRKAVVDSMVSNIIIENKAKELGLMPKEDEIKTEVDKQIQSTKDLYGSEEEFKKALETNGVTEELLRDNARVNVISKKVFDKTVEGITVDDKEVKQYYDTNTDQFKEDKDKVHTAHILVETKEEADAIKKQLDEGADFAKLAQEKSLDVVTKDKGGDLGFINYDDLSNGMTFMLAAKVLNKGEVSEPIQEKDGWHIIKVLEKQIYEPKPFDEVKDDIKAGILNSKQKDEWNKQFSKWTDEAKVKKYDKNLE